MTALADRVDRLDADLFSFVPMQAMHSDKRALLALHAAVAATESPFAYLEIGSFRGGSLQALVADPRCSCLMSIDPRTAETPDETRGAYTYQENTTELMLESLSQVPGADLGKLAAFETTTEAMDPAALPERPNCCFIDGEHTNDAVLNDARFCAEALAGAGVIAFHDWGIVRSAIKAFVHERRRDISFALAINRPRNPGTGFGVFALELGEKGILRHPALARATGARSYGVWAAANWTSPQRPAARAGLGRVDGERLDASPSPQAEGTPVVAPQTISVVMATYNGARYLEPQLDSIAAQTRLPDELVVCDDQSSDESVEILERFASHAPFEVRVVRNPERLGFAGNFLHAARLSRGDVIAWSDQDDVWMPEKLAICAPELENDDDVLLVAHASQFGEWMRRGRPVVRGATGDWFGRFTPRRVRRRTVYTPTSLPLRTRFPGRSSLVSRRVLEVADALETRLPGIIDEFESHHDIWIGFVAAAIGKVVILPDVLVQYRLHHAQVTGRAEPPKGAADLAKATTNRLGKSIERYANAHATFGYFRASILTQLAAQLDEAAGFDRGPAEFFVSLTAQVAAGGNRDAEAARNAARRSEMYRRHADVSLRRLELRRQRPLSKAAACLVANVARGDYGPRHLGGHGLRGLAVDLAPVSYRGARGSQLYVWEFSRRRCRRRSALSPPASRPGPAVRIAV